MDSASINVNETSGTPELGRANPYPLEVPIAGLNQAYGVSEPTFYKYIKALGIQRIEHGKLKYIRIEDKEKITCLVATLRRQQYPSIKEAIGEMRAKGISIPKSPEELQAETNSEEFDAVGGSLLNQSTLLKTSWEWLTEGCKREMPTFIQMGQAILAPLVNSVHQLSERMVALPPSSSLAQNLMEHYEFLERAAEKQWSIKTSKLAELLDLSPQTLSSKKVLERDGFRFSKVGRSGRESLWQVEKALLELDPTE
jgi:hypothetical protein